MRWPSGSSLATSRRVKPSFLLAAGASDARIGVSARRTRVAAAVRVATGTIDMVVATSPTTGTTVTAATEATITEV